MHTRSIMNRLGELLDLNAIDAGLRLIVRKGP
jgi:hypothetical protein